MGTTVSELCWTGFAVLLAIFAQQSSKLPMLLPVSLEIFMDSFLFLLLSAYTVDLMREMVFSVVSP